MYAIVEAGSKQFKVKVGDLISVENVMGLSGHDVVLPKVLLVSDKELTVGNPYLQKAAVLCEIVNQDKGPKLIIFKYKRRKGARNIRGHRQHLTLLKVKEISLTGVTAKAAPETEKVAKPKKTVGKKAVKRKPVAKKAAAVKKAK